MNNLHRSLAPISDAAWEEIEEEVKRTFRRSVSARKVVDVKEAGGPQLASVGTGHLQTITAPQKGIVAKQYIVKPLVQLVVPFELSREHIDAVEYGSKDSDWEPAKEAAQKIAYAEDRAIFDGYKEAGIVGIREGSSNSLLKMPAKIQNYPNVVSNALEELRLAGVDGPYSVVLGTDAYTALTEARDQGYPVIEHIRQIIKGSVIWSPGIVGGSVLSTRGGDYEMHIGEDLSIGYLSHTDKVVKLYLRESFTFLMLTSEASVNVSAS